VNAVLGNKKAIALLLGPALLVYTLVMLVPIFWSFGYTFQSGSPLAGFHWVGLTNFRTFFDDPTAWAAVRFTIKYAVVLTAGQILAGYGLALLYVFFLRRASGLIRTLVFFPIILPTVAVALLFQQIFASVPMEGPVNTILQGVGIDPIDWFGHPATAFWVIIVMDIWRSMGFYAVLLYAGLVDIPEEIIESARLDGAARWSLVRSIVIPLSFPVLISTVIFSINGTLKVFDSVLALTGGGPGTTTSPLTLYMFQTSFSYGDYGYGSTIALVLTILCLVVTVAILRTNRREGRGA